MKVKLKARGL
jgi:hypothetical protein